MYDGRFVNEKHICAPIVTDGTKATNIRRKAMNFRNRWFGYDGES